jgi:hypothetical protein
MRFMMDFGTFGPRMMIKPEGFFRKWRVEEKVFSGKIGLIEIGWLQ